MAVQARYQDPYKGVDESAITSNVIDTRTAFDVALTIRPDGGGASVLTYQISNASGGHAAVPDDTWSSWQTVSAADVGASVTSTFVPPLGYRFARWLRDPGSSVSWKINANMFER